MAFDEAGAVQPTSNTLVENLIAGIVQDLGLEELKLASEQTTVVATVAGPEGETDTQPLTTAEQIADLRLIISVSGPLLNGLLELMKDGLLLSDEVALDLTGELFALHQSAVELVGELEEGVPLTPDELELVEGLRSEFKELVSLAREQTKAVPAQEPVAIAGAEKVAPVDETTADTSVPAETREMTNEEILEILEQIVPEEASLKDLIDGTRQAATILSDLAGEFARLFDERDIDRENPDMNDLIPWADLSVGAQNKMTELRGTLLDIIQLGPDAPIEDLQNLFKRAVSLARHYTSVLSSAQAATSITVPTPTEQAPTGPVAEQETPTGESVTPTKDPVPPEDDVSPTQQVTDEFPVVEGDTDEDPADPEVVEVVDEVDEKAPTEEGVTEQPAGTTLTTLMTEGTEVAADLEALVIEFEELADAREFDRDTPDLLDSAPVAELAVAAKEDLRELQAEVVRLVGLGADAPIEELEAAITAAETAIVTYRGQLEVIKAPLDDIADAAGDAVGEVDTTEEPVEVIPVEDPAPTMADVATYGQEVAISADDLADRLAVFIQDEMEYVPFRVEIAHTGEWAEMWDDMHDTIQDIRDMVTGGIENLGDVDPEAMMATLEEKMAKIEEIEDYFVAMRSTMVTDEGPVDGPVELTEIGQVVADGDALLTEVNDLVDRAEDLFFEHRGSSEPTIAASAEWATIALDLREIGTDFQKELGKYLHGPEKDLVKAAQMIEEHKSTLENYADMINGVGGEAEETTTTEEPNRNRPAPTTRTELRVSADDLIVLAEQMAQMSADYFDEYRGVDTTDLMADAPWSTYALEAKGIADLIRYTLPGMMSGDNVAGGMTTEQMDEAWTFLLERKDDLDALRQKMNIWTGDMILKVDQGRVWGDPHFVGADGGKYDVQGVAGNVYNILSDKDIQVNARFDTYLNPGSGKTVMGAIGITLGDDEVQVNKDGTVQINGETLEDPGTYLGGKITITQNGSVEVREQEYSFRIDIRQSNHRQNWDHLNIEAIESDNAVADGVMPSGLWGVTVDFDDDARNGDAGYLTQGGGAIEDVDGTITERGDTSAVENYVVGGLFDTDFEHHNQFDG